MMNNYRIILISFFVFVSSCTHPGDRLENWQQGYLDIHHINTGCGECAYLVFPDGTTMLIDAGENNPDHPRHVPAKPDASKTPGEWIVDYIKDASPDKAQGIDYMLLTHFHNDHMGGVFDKPNPSGRYYDTGAITIAENLRVGKIVDRGFPDYSYLVDSNDKIVKNYLDFLHNTKSGVSVERFRPGADNQFALLYDSMSYKDLFKVQNIYANGRLWTGKDTLTTYLFPPMDSIAKFDIPKENSLSCVLKISYGKFSYYTGGDATGYPKPGRSAFHDIETPMGPVVGKTEVCCVNHHGYNNATNDAFLKALRPRVFIIQASDALHPNHSTLDRIFSEYIYKGPRDVFATNLHRAAAIVIGDPADNMKSTQGHIVVRVFEGGNKYNIYILEDGNTKRRIKAVFGPYACDE